MFSIYSPTLIQTIEEIVAKNEEDLFNKVEKIEEEAKAFGFYWETLDQLTEQIQSECHEIKEAWQNDDKNHLEEEVGDLMLAVASLAIFCNLDPKETFHKSIQKFEKRYQNLIKLVEDDGLKNLKGNSTEVLLEYWKKAKK